MFSERPQLLKSAPSDAISAGHNWNWWPKGAYIDIFVIQSVKITIKFVNWHFFKIRYKIKQRWKMTLAHFIRTDKAFLLRIKTGAITSSRAILRDMWNICYHHLEQYPIVHCISSLTIATTHKECCIFIVSKTVGSVHNQTLVWTKHSSPLLPSVPNYSDLSLMNFLDTKK